MSRCLSSRSIDHVVLERGIVANTWRRERWDSLRLLTPNWQARLPGFQYDGDDPDGYMSMTEVTDFISCYADAISAPVETSTCVTSVRATGFGYRVETDRGSWDCDAVVVASGAFNIPIVPEVGQAIPSTVAQLTPKTYRRPSDLAEGGVLVVGASATGLQLADEIACSGREVTLSIGEHVRMPRMYRGRDVQWWMDASGVLDEDYRDVDDLSRARRVPSPQLVGTPERTTLDLNTLAERGVQRVGRLSRIRDGRVQFSGSLRNVCRLADLKMNRLLQRFDEWAEGNGPSGITSTPERFEPTRLDERPCLEIGLDRGAIRTVLWATGYRPDYSWLDPRALDRKGRLRHDGGIGEMPGLYVMGLPFLRRRRSSFIHGAEQDARDLAHHLAGYIDDLRGHAFLALSG